MNDKSRPIYLPHEGKDFEDFTGRVPMCDDEWDKNQENELKTSKEKSHINNLNDQMEIGEEITFDNLNDINLNDESRIDIDSIIRNMDMSDHNYRDNNW